MPFHGERKATVILTRDSADNWINPTYNNPRDIIAQISNAKTLNKYTQKNSSNNLHDSRNGPAGDIVMPTRISGIYL